MRPSSLKTSNLIPLIRGLHPMLSYKSRKWGRDLATTSVEWIIAPFALIAINRDISLIIVGESTLIRERHSMLGGVVSRKPFYPLPTLLLLPFKP
jgi:hypothetical protein